MSTPIDGTTYPFDPTGKLASNLITGEMQALVPGDQGNSFHFIVPDIAPYFVDSLVAIFKDTNGNPKTLVEGVDYVCTHVFHDASLACASPIAGSISFYNLSLAGQIQLQYQTLGGIWTLNMAAITTILADRLHNPRITTWEQVTDQPVTFPVIDHEWNLVDLVGMSEVVTELQNIEAILRSNSGTGLAAHIADHNNPHFTTQDQVGLGLVQNYGMATNADGVAGVRTDLYMSPAATQAAITNAVTNLPEPGLPTANEVGAYSESQTDALLAEKLGTQDQAADSAEFGGMTPQQWTTQINGSTVANSLQFGGQSPSDYAASVLTGTSAATDTFGGLTAPAFIAEVVTTVEQVIGNDLNFAEQQEFFIAPDASASLWTQLATATLPQSTDPAGTAFTDLQMIVTGGDSYDVDTISGMWFVRLSVRGGSSNPISMSVIDMLGANITGVHFGFVTGVDSNNNQAAEVWVQSKGNRNSLYTTSLNVKGTALLTSQTPVDTAPSGLTLVTPDAYVMASDIVATLTNLTTAVENLQTQITGE